MYIYIYNNFTKTHYQVTGIFIKYIEYKNKIKKIFNFNISKISKIEEIISK